MIKKNYGTRMSWTMGISFLFDGFQQRSLRIHICLAMFTFLIVFLLDKCQQLSQEYRSMENT